MILYSNKKIEVKNMKNIEEKIEKAIALITEEEKLKKQVKVDKLFNSIYPFTTENIKGYLKDYQVKNERILTVGASGDHLLNLLLLGANTIDYFDVNPFTEVFIELKIAAVKALDEEEFIDYFSSSDWTRNNPCMHFKQYQKISPFLKEECRLFWDTLYLELGGEEIRFSKLFDRDEPSSRLLKEINLYLEKENYSKLKAILLKNQYHLHFYEKNLKDLKEVLNKKYKMIILSNIAKYLRFMYDTKNQELKEQAYYLRRFKQTIEGLFSYLEESGILFIAYLYDLNVNESSLYPIYNTKLRKRYFPKSVYQLQEFEGINQIKYRYQDEEKDAVLIYKKIAYNKKEIS